MEQSAGMELGRDTQVTSTTSEVSFSSYAV